MITYSLYHGSQATDSEGIGGGVRFFSQNRDFSNRYGIVNEYQVTFRNLFDSCSKEHIEHLLAHEHTLIDPYDEKEYRSYEELEDSRILGMDTWELFEAYMDTIVRMGFDGMVIYEGGYQNYAAFNASQYRLKEPVSAC